MKIEVNIEKKYAFAIIGLLVIIASLITGYAFSQSGTGGTPSNMGHSVDEIDWSKTINSNVAVNGNLSSSGVCIAGNCKTDWNQVSSSSDSSNIYRYGFMSGNRIGSFSYGVSNIPAGRWAVKVEFRGEPDRGSIGTLSTGLNGVAGPSFNVATDNEWPQGNGNYYNPSWTIDVTNSGNYANQLNVSLSSTWGMTAIWGNFEAHKVA